MVNTLSPLCETSQNKCLFKLSYGRVLSFNLLLWPDREKLLVGHKSLINIWQYLTIYWNTWHYLTIFNNIQQILAVSALRELALGLGTCMSSTRKASIVSTTSRSWLNNFACTWTRSLEELWYWQELGYLEELLEQGLKCFNCLKEVVKFWH